MCSDLGDKKQQQKIRSEMAMTLYIDYVILEDGKCSHCGSDHHQGKNLLDQEILCCESCDNYNDEIDSILELLSPEQYLKVLSSTNPSDTLDNIVAGLE